MGYDLEGKSLGKFWGWIAKLSPERVKGNLGTDRLNVHLIYLENNTGRIRLIAEGVSDVDYNPTVRPIGEAMADFKKISDDLRIGRNYILDAETKPPRLRIVKEAEGGIKIEP